MVQDKKRKKQYEKCGIALHVALADELMITLSHGKHHPFVTPILVVQQ